MEKTLEVMRTIHLVVEYQQMKHDRNKKRKEAATIVYSCQVFEPKRVQ